nr:coiled-coil domain-containing protein 97 [Ipomoea batatas]
MHCSIDLRFAIPPIVNSILYITLNPKGGFWDWDEHPMMKMALLVALSILVLVASIKLPLSLMVMAAPLQVQFGDFYFSLPLALGLFSSYLFPPPFFWYAYMTCLCLSPWLHSLLSVVKQSLRTIPTFFITCTTTLGAASLGSNNGRAIEEYHQQVTVIETEMVEMAKALSSGTMDRISDRLSQLDNLYFPRAVQSSAATPSLRKSLLLDLLSRDVPLFLERYGSLLTTEELKEFDVLKDDYEINWHLNHLLSVISPTQEELKSRSVKIKNRRRAYLDKLISGGQYFSEDAMREREPYLHHEYVGKFQDPSGRSMARPGERWSETLMRRSEEAMLVEKIRNEQQKRGELGLEEEGEKDEKQNPKDTMVNGPEIHANKPEGSNNLPYATTIPSEMESLSVEDMQDRMDQFTYIMQQKFLLGEDNLDYSKIDEDEALDDHWIKEANYDAEEKYFDDI